MTYCKSSFESDFRMVVFPALSRPKTHIRTFLVADFFFEKIELRMEPVVSITENIFIISH